jgi:hypothetical protein
MEVNQFGLGYLCISAAYFVSDDHNMFKAGPGYAEVDIINQVESPVILTKNSPEYANARQRLGPNPAVIVLVCNEDALAGERYYAIIG